jgi:hypothetical protein
MDAAAKGRVFDWGKFHDRQEGRAVERREKRGMAYSSSPVNYNDDRRQQKRRRMRSPSSSASSYYRLRRCSPSSSHQPIRNSSHKNGDPKPRNRVYHYHIHAEPGASIVINRRGHHIHINTGSGVQSVWHNTGALTSTSAFSFSFSCSEQNAASAPSYAGHINHPGGYNSEGDEGASGADGCGYRWRGGRKN